MLRNGIWIRIRGIGIIGKLWVFGILWCKTRGLAGWPAGSPCRWRGVWWTYWSGNIA